MPSKESIPKPPLQQQEAAPRERRLKNHIVSRPPVASWVPFLAGGIGGINGAVVTSPLDVVRTRLQAQNNKAVLEEAASSRRFGFGTLSHLRAVVATEGSRGLYRGLAATLTGVFPSRAVHLGTYTFMKSRLTEMYGDTSTVHCAAATFAGLTVATATAPIWMVKTRMQLQSVAVMSSGGATGTKGYSNSLECVRRIYAEEGFRGFYKGLSASCIGVSESAFQFVLYERLKRWIAAEKTGGDKFHESQVSVVEYLSASCAAKLIASSVTYPHEVARTRLREQRGPNLKYRNFFHCLKRIHMEEGWAALYGGMGAHLLRVVPNAMIMFLTYEMILTYAGTGRFFHPTPPKAAETIISKR
eukprot:TRINITY_DN1408_c0_g1_i1.p1 TRINITY_DN1408_c0_g1~~TRINITY_DN1408_c0_g1_i1.p1  ORF type:complete len:358 (-),score=32.39 TRINITY_DN1408_c0_g1_i1:82-1155(-)